MRKLTASLVLGCLAITLPVVALAQTTSDYVPMIEGWKADGSNLKGFQKNQFGFAFPGVYTNYSLVKVYVPAGTTEFSVTGSLPQQTPYAVVSRFGKPPERTSLTGSIGSGEYGDINRSFSQGKAFAQLLAGEEMIQVHDGGGSTGYVGAARLNGRPLLKGKWLYMRVLTGSEGGISSFQGGGEVDLTMYTEGMAGVAFQVQGNGLPTEDNKLIGKPIGIKLEPSRVSPGGIAYIKPLVDGDKEAIALGRCNVDQTSTLAPFVTITNYVVSVSPSAPLGVAKIECGDATNFASDTAFLSPAFSEFLNIGPIVSLQNIELTPGNINTATPGIITINPVPVEASLGKCELGGSGAGLVNLIGNTIALTPGVSVSEPTQTIVTCSGVSANFIIQPPPALTLTPSTLIQGSGTSSTVKKSDGTPATSCQLASTNVGFDPNVYLDWNSSTIKFKTAVATLSQKQTVSVTCDGSLSATLTLDPAPVGLLYPLHDNDDGSGVTPAPQTRDEKKIVLRWREANASGEVIYSALEGKYPSYPTASSATEFICAEVDDSDIRISPERVKFLSSGAGAVGSTQPSLELTPAADAISVQTKILCYVRGRAEASPPIEESKKRMTISISNGKWQLPVPTVTNPIIDLSDKNSAKLQILVPKAVDPTEDVRVYVQLYSPVDKALPVFFATPGRNMPLQLKPYDKDASEVEFVYLTVPASDPTRVKDIDLIYPKSVYGSSSLKAKAVIWYRYGNGFMQIKTLGNEWDSANPN